MLEGHKQRKKQNKLDKVVKPPQAKPTACKSAAPHLQETSKHGAKAKPKGPPTKKMLEKVSWTPPQPLELPESEDALTIDVKLSMNSAETRERSDVRLREAIDIRAGVGTKEETKSEPEDGPIGPDDAEDKGYPKEEQPSDSPDTFSEGEETQRSEDRQPRSGQNRGMQASIRGCKDPAYVAWAADCDNESHRQDRHYDQQAPASSSGARDETIGLGKETGANGTTSVG